MSGNAALEKGLEFLKHVIWERTAFPFPVSLKGREMLLDNLVARGEFWATACVFDAMLCRHGLEQSTMSVRLELTSIVESQMSVPDREHQLDLASII